VGIATELPYARLPVEEEDDLLWAFRRRAVSGNCLSIAARAGTGRAKRAEMTLERQADVASDMAMVLRTDSRGDIGGSYFNRRDRHLEQQWH